MPKFEVEKFAQIPKNYYAVYENVATERTKGRVKLGVVSMEVLNGLEVWIVTSPKRLLENMEEFPDLYPTKNVFFSQDDAVQCLYRWQASFRRKRKQITEQQALSKMVIPAHSVLYGYGLKGSNKL
jgi:hypothetical protein